MVAYEVDGNGLQVAMNRVLVESPKMCQRTTLVVDESDEDLLGQVVRGFYGRAHVQSRMARGLGNVSSVRDPSYALLEAGNELEPRRIFWTRGDQAAHQIPIGELLQVHDLPNYAFGAPTVKGDECVRCRIQLPRTLPTCLQ